MNECAGLLDVVVFATSGTLTVAQEIISVLMRDLPGADPELVAEETLALVSVATARAVERGCAPRDAGRLSTAIVDIPLTLRDYLVGGALLEGDDARVDADEAVYARLKRKTEFYDSHLPLHELPIEKVLGEKAALWMGRLSPPRLPEMPDVRLERLGLVAKLTTHLRLVFEMARQQSTAEN